MANILLIEDNFSNAEMIMRILVSVGHVIRHSARGLEGAQIARRETPDLILMDFDLPDVDGRAMGIVLRRQLGGTDAPPIVAITARSGGTEQRIAQQLGFSAFVGKPFTPDQLIATVESVLSHRKVR
jgi:CheY-like chemotaxis protein